MARQGRRRRLSGVCASAAPCLPLLPCGKLKVRPVVGIAQWQSAGLWLRKSRVRTPLPTPPSFLTPSNNPSSWPSRGGAFGDRLPRIPVSPEMPDHEEGKDDAGDPADDGEQRPEAESCANAHETGDPSGGLTRPIRGGSQLCTVNPIIATLRRHASRAGRVAPADPQGFPIST